MTIYQPTIQLKEFIDENGVAYQDTFLDDNKNISFIYGIDSVSQTVATAIKMWKQEYQFDTTIGIDWGAILGEPLNRLLLNNSIQSQVLLVPYVVNVISIDYIMDNKNRVTSVTVKYNNVDKIVSVANANI